MTQSNVGGVIIIVLAFFVGKGRGAGERWERGGGVIVI